MTPDLISSEKLSISGNNDLSVDIDIVIFEPFEVLFTSVVYVVDFSCCDVTGRRVSVEWRLYISPVRDVLGAEYCLL